MTVLVFSKNTVKAQSFRIPINYFKPYIKIEIVKIKSKAKTNFVPSLPLEEEASGYKNSQNIVNLKTVK